MLNLTKPHNNRLESRGFTIVEITISIIVIGILSTIIIFGFGAWKQKTATAEVENDLRQLATAMQSHKNFNSGYPVLTPGVEFDGQNGQSSKIFSASPGVTLVYVSGDANRFCVEATSTRVSDLTYHIDSQKDGTTGQPTSGKCITAPQTITDNFNRSQSNLGKTSTGDVEWANLSGDWKTNGSQAILSANSSSSSPLAVVDYQRSDADVSATVGPSDAIYFRVSDAGSWWRLGQTSRTETTTYTTSEPYTYYTTETVYGYCSINSSYSYNGRIPTEGWAPGSTGYSYGSGNCSSTPYSYFTITNSYFDCKIYGYTAGASGHCWWADQYSRSISSVPNSTRQVAHTGYQNVTHTTTTTYYKLVLEKSYGGEIQSVWSSTESTTQPSLVRAVASGDNISVYNAASGSPLVTITDNFNLYASLYGIGRTVSVAAGSGIDNFSLTKP